MASSRAVPVGDARLRAHYLADPARPKTVAFLNTIQPIESVHAELHHSVIAAEPQQRIRTFNTREYVYYIYAKTIPLMKRSEVLSTRPYLIFAPN